jgi:hypothetical protein
MRRPRRGSAIILVAALSAVVCLPEGRAAAAGEALSPEYKMAFTDSESKELRLDVVPWDDSNAVAKEFGLGLTALPAEGADRTAFLTKPGGDIMFGAEFHDEVTKSVADSLPRLQKLLHGELPQPVERDLRERGFFSVSGWLSKSYAPNLLLLRLVRSLEARRADIDEAMQKVSDEPGSTVGLQSLTQVLHSEMDGVLTASR